MQKDETLFQYDTLDETVAVPTTGGTLKDLINWTLQTIKYMGMAYKSINKANNEATRRELISPFFVAAILLAGGLGRAGLASAALIKAVLSLAGWTGCRGWTGLG